MSDSLKSQNDSAESVVLTVQEYADLVHAVYDITEAKRRIEIELQATHEAVDYWMIQWKSLFNKCIQGNNPSVGELLSEIA